MCPIVESNTEHGITWLQVFATYLLNGGCNEAAMSEGLVGARPKLAPLYKQFISESKALFQFVSHEFKKLLRPLRNGLRPLADYGITTFLPML